MAVALALCAAGALPARAEAAAAGDSLKVPPPAHVTAPPVPDSLAGHATVAPADSAAEARRDSVAAAPDTAAAPRRRAPAEPTGFDRPRYVMLRSLVIPGWGQVHNGAWIKAGAIAGTEGLFIVKLIGDKHALDDYERNISEAQAAGDLGAEQIYVGLYNDRSNSYVAHQWWLGAVLAYSLLDAYIDAHFRNFSVDIGDDPALPAGDRHAAGLKLSLQRHF